jgi:hypothetical protein
MQGGQHACPVRPDHLSGAIDDHLRRINLTQMEYPRIGSLPVRRALAGERILPSKSVPVADVETQGDHIVASFQFPEQRIGGRAGGAALRGEELDHDGSGLGARR